jgi:hypothetical protein
MKPQEIADIFARDIAKHELTIIKNDGVYRHVKCASPGENSWNKWFEIITWPGCLAYHGDMGDYVFSRTEDMFSFFRRSDGGINPEYWEEKCVSADKHDGVKKFSVETFRANVIEDAKQYLEYEDDEDIDTETMGALEELLTAEDEYECVTRMNDFDSDLVEFNDFWERDCTEYTHRFIWCLRAIVWTIAKFDAIITRAEVTG